MQKYDMIIIGAGAAGIVAAATATARGRRVAVLDIGARPARKVMVSGGGRCNFTNDAVSRDRYFGENPDFVRGAIARVTPCDILDWARGHGLEWTEKSPGQYFCTNGAAAIVNALRQDAQDADIILGVRVCNVAYESNEFIINTSSGKYYAQSVIIATGGISFPALGVSDAGYLIAKKFGHKIIPIRPALCAIATNVFRGAPAGLSMPAEITIGTETIMDSMLITHFGIGGPAVYRATVRNISDGITVNIMPGINAYEFLRDARMKTGRKSLQTVLATHIPARMAQWIAGANNKNIADYNDAELTKISDKINRMHIPYDKIRLHGMPSAEVVRGGVSTDKISSKTMESKIRPGLFFAGEVLDIAGDLGGFNLHWAWASGRVAGNNA